MSMYKFLTTAVFASTVLGAPAPQKLAERQSSSYNNIDLIHELQLAPTAVDRINLLSNEDFIYDFNNPPPDTTTTGDGGHTVKADRKSFPALIGTGVSMTLGKIPMLDDGLR